MERSQDHFLLVLLVYTRSIDISSLCCAEVKPWVCVSRACSRSRPRATAEAQLSNNPLNRFCSVSESCLWSLFGRWSPGTGSDHHDSTRLCSGVNRFPLLLQASSFWTPGFPMMRVVRLHRLLPADPGWNRSYHVGFWIFGPGDGWRVCLPGVFVQRTFWVYGISGRFSLFTASSSCWERRWMIPSHSSPHWFLGKCLFIERLFA